MRAFSCPAKYKAFIERELERVLATVRLDGELRSDDCARIRTMALVPEAEINGAVAGTCTIIVNVSGDPDSRKRIRDVIATASSETHAGVEQMAEASA